MVNGYVGTGGYVLGYTDGMSFDVGDYDERISLDPEGLNRIERARELGRKRRGQPDLVDKALETVLNSAFLRCYLIDLTDEQLAKIVKLIEGELTGLRPLVVEYFKEYPIEFVGSISQKFLAYNAMARTWLASIPQGTRGPFGTPNKRSLINKYLNRQRKFVKIRQFIKKQSIKMVGKGGIKVWGRYAGKALPLVGYFTLAYDVYKACHCKKVTEDDKFTEDERGFGQ